MSLPRMMGWSVLVVAVLVSGCSTDAHPRSQVGSTPPGAKSLKNPPVVEYGTFPRAIPIPQPTPELAARFNADAKGDVVTVPKPGGIEVSGHVTDNQTFFEQVMRPALEPHVEALRAMPPTERINALALFGHETYRTWFGRDAFAWGGHIRDLDDPQESGPNFDHRYGFDCSGFAALPYELAVELGVMKPDDPAVVVSSVGFARMACLDGLPDLGGRGDTANNWRVDTGDMENLGRVVTTIAKGARATPEQLALLQPGDLVLAPGHVGLVVELGGKLWYLEHGGWVCPPNGGLPFAIDEALAIFAEINPLTIRRTLPDRTASHEPVPGAQVAAW